MELFKRKKDRPQELVGVESAPKSIAAAPIFGLDADFLTQNRIYSEIRSSVPIIDAAIGKLVRLLGSFEIKGESRRFETQVNAFLKSVKVNGGASGINSFIYAYFDSLLTYGTAVGEIVLTSDCRSIGALYNAGLDNVSLLLAPNEVDVAVRVQNASGGYDAVKNDGLVLVTLLNPEPGTAKGTSVLRGLPFVCDVLMKIFKAVGSNWERMGNVRFAVTYKPQNGGAYSAQNAKKIADEWSKAMRDSSRVCDFVSVGDIDVKVIGADNKILDSEVPVRQLLEQITAKLSVPPFLLGLSWSTTERMSQQQADILTSEMDYYREILNPAIRKIVGVWQRLNGFGEAFDIEWSNISLQDELSLAQARYENARAEQLETEENA